MLAKTRSYTDLHFCFRLLRFYSVSFSTIVWLYIQFFSPFAGFNRRKWKAHRRREYSARLVYRSSKAKLFLSAKIRTTISFHWCRNFTTLVLVRRGTGTGTGTLSCNRLIRSNFESSQSRIYYSIVKKNVDRIELTSVSSTFFFIASWNSIEVFCAPARMTLKFTKQNNTAYHRHIVTDF